MKKIGPEVCSVSWDVGSGWVGSHVWCNMESCSGKVQERGVWDENLGVWGFVTCLWNVGSGWVGTHAWCNLFRVVPAKFKTGMCEMKIFGSEVCSVSWDVGSGWVGSHVWCNMGSCSGKVQNRCVRWQNSDLKFVVSLGTLVHDGLAHMCGVVWRAAPAKFKTRMCEMKIFGSEVLWCIFGTLVQGWHTCV